MSFNKKHVPQLEELKVRHLERGDSYLQVFEKADCLIGPTESINYIYLHLNRINGKTPDANSETIDEVLVLLNTAYDRLSQISDLSLASSEIKKVINYITIKQ
jgi:hypothetical protein